jgi:O-antigen/teichoic acid export membrane protein
LFHANGDARNERAVVGICICALTIVGVVLAPVITLVAGPVGRAIGADDTGLARFLLLCALAIMITGLIARVLAAASVGRGRQVHANVGLAILSTLQAAGGVLALFVHPALREFALGTVIGTALGLLIVITLIVVDERGIAIGQPSVSLTRDILAYGLTSQIAAAGGMLLLQSGKLIAGIMVGPAAAGLFELASRLAIGAQVLGASTAAALVPHLTRRYAIDGMDGVLKDYQRLTRRNTAVVILTPFAMAATAFAGIPLWLGSRNDAVVFILLALLPGIATNLSTGVCSSLISAIGRPGIIAKIAVVGGVFQAILAAVLGYFFGIAGIAIAFAIGVPIANVWSMWHMQRRVKIQQALFMRAIAGPFLLALLATLVAFPIGVLTDPGNRSQAIWPFVVSGVVFVLVYATPSSRLGYFPRLSSRRPPSIGRSDMPNPHG